MAHAGFCSWCETKTKLQYLSTKVITVPAVPVLYGVPFRTVALTESRSAVGCFYSSTYLTVICNLYQCGEMQIHLLALCAMKSL